MGNTVAQLSTDLRDRYLEGIAQDLRQPSYLSDLFEPKSLDWGFDEIWPSTKSWEQKWFKRWDYEARRRAMSSFERVWEDELGGLHRDMRRDMGRQFTIKVEGGSMSPKNGSD